jgi:hypothetical protein
MLGRVEHAHPSAAVIFDIFGLGPVGISQVSERHAGREGRSEQETRSC